MRYIGNILTSSSPSRFPSYFNVVNDERSLKRGVPTLVVGYERADAMFGGVDSTERRDMPTGYYWTFGRTESRQDFEADMEKFVVTCAKKACKNVEYRYLDIMRYSLTALKRLVSFFDSDDVKICYLTRGDSFLFVYCIKTGRVLGLSLSFLEYNGVHSDKVIGRIKSNSRNWFVYNARDVMNSFGKAISDDIHLIPVLAGFLRNGKTGQSDIYL